METLAALDLPFDEAIQFLKEKTNVTSEGWEDVWQRANAKSFTVAGATTEALVRDFRDEVAKAIETGSSIQAFRQTFDQIVQKHGWKHVGTPGWRSRIIFETNLSMAYAAGRYKQMTEPVTLQAFPYWQYVHSGARHPRLQHKAWNGLTLRADDPFWSWAYPPNGWRCGCRVRPLTAEGLKRQGKRRPDTAPEREFIGYTVKTTGEIKQATVGIDPGFDYNVGEAWLADTTIREDRSRKAPRGTAVFGTPEGGKAWRRMADRLVRRSRQSGLEEAGWSGGHSEEYLSGGKREVRLPQEAITAMADPERRLVLHHTHPSGLGLSGADVAHFARSPGLAELVAHGLDRQVYRIERVAGSSELLEKEFQSVEGKLMGLINTLTERNQLAAARHHIICVVLANQGFFRYSARVPRSTVTAIDRHRTALERLFGQLP